MEIYGIFKKIYIIKKLNSKKGLKLKRKWVKNEMNKFIWLRHDYDMFVVLKSGEKMTWDGHYC